MRRITAVVAIVVCTLGFDVGIASAKAAPIPTLKSPSGHLYKAGELCPGKDLGKASHSSGSSIIKCEFTTVNNKKHNYWVKVK